jgi:serine/threonine-protein kinase
MDSKFFAKLLTASAFLGLVTAFLVMKAAIRGGTVTMPDLAGRPRASAVSQLRVLGLGLKVDEERYSNAQPNDSVLSQDIPAGSQIKRGRTVHVAVSRGSAKASAPELSGLPLRQAMQLLQQNGLEPGVVDRVPSDQPRDTVLAQNPESGITVGHGAEISLLVSDGPAARSYLMPNLAGRTVEAATAALGAMGLKADPRPVDDAQHASGTVLSQSAPVGSATAPGSEVALQVARKPGEGGPARFATVEYQVPADGSSERRVRITVHDDQGSRVIYQEMEKPGARVSAKLTAHGKATYTVSLSGHDVATAAIP